jgi:hypothetical protein
LDATIDFDIGRVSMLAALIPGTVPSFPTQHFSVWWRGHLQAPASSLYRITIETYEAAYFDLQLNNVTIVQSRFLSENELSTSTTLTNNSFYSADIWLEQDALVPISLRYAEKLGETKIRLLWESDSLEQ